MKRYELRKSNVQVDRKEFDRTRVGSYFLEEQHCDGNAPELIAIYDTKEEAVEALDKHENYFRDSYSPCEVEEYFVEVTEWSEEVEEWCTCGDYYTIEPKFKKYIVGIGYGENFRDAMPYDTVDTVAAESAEDAAAEVFNGLDPEESEGAFFQVREEDNNEYTYHNF